ncbi:HalOD1 output domain-containing protein [Halomicrobium salinisoli]|uniref:HalOD1 output domain-containing protein n=1 Tax=Halomicrobium salinisoli TaxID=2878391 RepID=UPI001CF05D0B|nr:HalOD1 output domain-containing protein [Halomicrobium salinisoli]
MESSRTPAANAEIAESLSPIQIDIENESFRATYDSARDSATLAVVAAVSTALDREPRNLTPLQSAVETDALDRLATGSSTGSGTRNEISFDYEGLEITVTGEGVIEANPIENT